MSERAGEMDLLARLHAHRQDLLDLLSRSSDHSGFEDPVYRFYHQSFKVYWLQERTNAIVRMLETLSPERALNPRFMQIVRDGTGKMFNVEDNQTWLPTTRPILEAFFHARYFLEMAVRYETLSAPPMPLPSGYAALLYLYGLR